MNAKTNVLVLFAALAGSAANATQPKGHGNGKTNTPVASTASITDPEMLAMVQKIDNAANRAALRLAHAKLNDGQKSDLGAAAYGLVQSTDLVSASSDKDGQVYFETLLEAAVARAHNDAIRNSGSQLKTVLTSDYIVVKGFEGAAKRVAGYTH